MLKNTTALLFQTYPKAMIQTAQNFTKKIQSLFDSFNDCVRHKPYITETVGPVTVLTGVKAS